MIGDRDDTQMRQDKAESYDYTEATQEGEDETRGASSFQSSYA